MIANLRMLLAMDDIPPDFKFKLSDDQKTVTIEMPTNELSALGLDKVLRALGVGRSSMRPSHPSSPPEPKDWPYHELTAYYFKPEVGNPPSEGFALLVRSPLFGWGYYPFSKDDAGALLRFLADEDQETPPGPLN